MVDHWINNQRMASGTRSPISGTESPGSSFLKKKMTIKTKVGSKSPAFSTGSIDRSLLKKRLTIHASTSEYEPTAKKGTSSLSERFSAKAVAASPQVSSTTKKTIVPKVQRISVQVPNDTKKLGWYGLFSSLLTVFLWYRLRGDNILYRCRMLCFWHMHGVT